MIGVTSNNFIYVLFFISITPSWKIWIIGIHSWTVWLLIFYHFLWKHFTVFSLICQAKFVDIIRLFMLIFNVCFYNFKLSKLFLSILLINFYFFYLLFFLFFFIYYFFYSFFILFLFIFFYSSFIFFFYSFFIFFFFILFYFLIFYSFLFINFLFFFIY